MNKRNSVLLMESPNQKAPMNNNLPIDRYKTLNLEKSLSNPSLYVFACKELSFILKYAYSISPKNLQSLIFQETIFAFTLLPEVQTQSAISAANSLLQSAECALPKHKRALAVTEHRQAVVASKRKSKMNKDEEVLSLFPQDVLVHIFGFLDVQSVVSASAVCRSWNAAASDNHLWKSLYTAFFAYPEDVTMYYGFKIHGVAKNLEKIHSLEKAVNGVGIDWKRAFKTAFKETSFRKFKSNRGYCWNCSSIVWLSNNRCSNISNSKEDSHHQITSISRQQIVEYILGGCLLSDSSSDSDDDTADSSLFKLWAYPKQII